MDECWQNQYEHCFFIWHTWRTHTFSYSEIRERHLTGIGSLLQSSSCDPILKDTHTFSGGQEIIDFLERIHFFIAHINFPVLRRQTQLTHLSNRRTISCLFETCNSISIVMSLSHSTSQYTSGWLCTWTVKELSNTL